VSSPPWIASNALGLQRGSWVVIWTPRGSGCMC